MRTNRRLPSESADIRERASEAVFARPLWSEPERPPILDATEYIEVESSVEVSNNVSTNWLTPKDSGLLELCIVSWMLCMKGLRPTR